MTLAGRLLAATTVLTVATLVVLGLSLREAWRSAEAARFEAQLTTALGRVSADVEGQMTALPKLLSPLCAHDPVLDAALVDMKNGNLDARRLPLSLRVPELAKAMRLDELVLLTRSGEILGSFPDSGSVGSKNPTLARITAKDASTARLRSDRGPVAVEAHCIAAAAGVSLALYGAKHLVEVLETAGAFQGVTLSLTPPANDSKALVSKAQPGGTLAGLTLYGQSSRTPLLESLKQLDRTVLGLGLGTLAAALLFAVLLSRGLARPIVELSEQAGRVVDGEPVPVVGRGGRELEEFARAFNHAIADLVALRKRLAVAERIAARREIARRVAHEIKNPLAPIQAAVETLRRLRQRDDPAFDEYFDEATRTVLSEVRRITDIVSEFTKLGRLPALRPAPVDLRKTVDEAARLHATTGVAISVSGEAVPEIVADRDQLIQALTNLFLNAVDAARGTESPRVDAWVGPGADGFVKVRVEDNGPGIPAEVRARLFEPYVTTKAHGTGLGLAIVQRIVFEHGGEITYEDAGFGSGARFVITLPIAGPALLPAPPDSALE